MTFSGNLISIFKSGLKYQKHERIKNVELIFFFFRILSWKQEAIKSWSSLLPLYFLWELLKVIFRSFYASRYISFSQHISYFIFFFASFPLKDFLKLLCFVLCTKGIWLYHFSYSRSSAHLMIFQYTSL